MSVPQTKTAESKSKSKFQSLNINNLYQGAASKPQSKNLPPKHGLQSLGKVPTARRAPANLPSVKSEKGGNDPSVVLVPSGGGWANKEGDKEGSVGVEKQGEQGQGVKERQGVVDVAGTAPVKQQSPPSKASGVKSWSSVTGSGQGGPHGGRQQSFLHQKSPLFGQEFPSLKPGEVAPAGSQAVKGSTPEHVEQPSSAQTPADPPTQPDPAYGPGPNLRPQTFGNWTQGGAAGKGGGSGGPQTEGAELLPLVPPQPHKPVPPQAPPPTRSPPTNQYKSIMPPFMDAMELPTGPPPNFSHRRSAPRQGGSQAPRHREHRPRPPTDTQTNFVPPSIIDKEKLKRMDDIDNGDDWTYEDDDFDYNKKLESEDEDAVEAIVPSTVSDPNWADQCQVPGSQHSRSPHQPQQQQQNFNFYEEFKQKGGVGFGVDEEEKRRNKKSEEVMKNIERARQRREEEENRYRRQGGQEQDREGGNHYRETYRQRGEGGVKYEERGQQRRGGGAGEGRPRNYDDRDRYERDRHYEGGYREEGPPPPPPHYKRKDDYRGERRYEREEEMHSRERQEYGRHREGWEREGLGQQPFDMEGEDKRRAERQRYQERERSPGGARSPAHPRSPGLTPQYQRHDSEVSATESSEADRDRRQQAPMGSTSPDWVDKNSHTIQDWVEDVEEGDNRDLSQQYQREKEYDREFRDSEGREYDRPSRPNSRDSRVSKESRGSKESKGSRTSRDREVGISVGVKKEEKSGGKFEKDGSQLKPQNEFEHDKKGRQPKQAPVQDLRGYFRDGVEQEKKPYRHAPGPITREKLESVEVRESMTQLKKRETPKSEEKLEEKPEPEKIEPPLTLSGLVDADMLENISEDEDNLLDEVEKEVTSSNIRGRGRGRGRGGDKDRQFVSYPRGKGDRGGERGGRGGRGGRMDNKRGGMQNRWTETEEMEENDEERRMKKQSGQNQNQNNNWGFMPRGQPSRRGRGEGRGRQGCGGGVGRQRGFEEFGSEEIGEWGEDDTERKGGGRGKVPPRMQRGRREGARPGSGGGDEGEEWETASETSLEEREKRNKARVESQPVRARGGRGRGGQQQGHWDKPRGRGGSGSGNAGGGAQTGAGGPAEGVQREGTPEAPAKRGPGIENFDLNDYAGVVIVDDPQWVEGREGENQGEYNNMENAEGFMQVVNKKTRGGMGPQMKDRRMVDNRMNDRNDYRRPGGPDMFDKKMSKTAYDRRQSKLPPRLAKQREVVRAQARSGPGQLSPSPGNENGWPEGDKMGVFTVEPDIGTGAWEKPMEGGGINQTASTENGSIQGTIIFENTNFKGGKTEKMDKTGPGGPIQLPLSFGKQEADNADLKLDFTFGGDEGVLKPGPGQAPPLSIPRSLTAGGLPASPSTDDLQTKLANTKKLWDAPGMPVVPENSTAGGSWNESDLYGENGESTAEKNGEREAGPVNSPHSVVSNVAKVKPQQQQLNLDSDTRANNAALQYNRMAVPSPPGNHNLPPSQLAPALQPWAFLPDASRTSPMYNPYSQLNQSILMPGVTGHNINTDLFNSNNGGYRGVASVPNFPGSGGHTGHTGHTTTNNVLISQASLINSQVKLGSGIGPIGTKAGAGGPGPSSPYLANLPNTNSNIFIQYDNSGNPLNLPSYLPGSAPHPGPGRGNTPSQTAFYQSLAAANRQQQAFNALQGFNSAQHALSQQQLRASAVAGMPFLKSEQAKSPGAVSISDTGFTATACPYNGRATNPGGPPSPKTKLKMAQQQEQAKITANMNNLQNLNNLNALAQMQRTMGLGQYNPLSGLVQPTVPGQYNPSPIARPQVSMAQGGAMMAGGNVQGQINKQMNQYFNQEGVDSDKYEGGEEVVAADKVDAEEATEELCEAGQEASQQPTEAEAGAAN